MKSKTDPATGKSKAILNTQDKAAVARTIDVLNNAAVIEGKGDYTVWADELRGFIAADPAAK
jgi:hypothetical protein